MKAEKILLLFIAVVIGLCVSGVSFYFYESGKTLPPSKLKTISLSPSVTPTSSLPLLIDSPQNESTTDTRIIKITGKTSPDATIIITTPSTDQVIAPVSTGDFSTSVTIDDGENDIHITAVGANGDETQKNITVTYTTEDF